MAEPFPSYVTKFLRVEKKKVMQTKACITFFDQNYFFSGSFL